MRAKILHTNLEKLPLNIQWFTVRVTGVPRSVIIELNRHRSLSTTQKSSRFTLQEIKGRSFELMNAKDGDDIWGKYIYLTGNKHIDGVAHRNLANTAQLLEDGFSNDEVKSTLPEGFLLNGVWTMSMEDWEHLYRLRSSKQAFKPIREFVNEIDRVLKTVPKTRSNSIYDYDKYRQIARHNYSPITSSAIAIRECYNTHSKSDNGGKKDKSLIERIGVSMRHSSTLEHLNFLVVLKPVLDKEKCDILLKHKYVETAIIGTEDKYGKVVLARVNMRVVIENSKLREELMSWIPKEYHYLLPGQSYLL